MMVLAVTLHNIPEGMAVGVMYAGFLAGNSQITAASALALSLGIAIQNFPEGAIISMPLKAEGQKKSKAFLGGVLSGVVEPVGAVLTLLAAQLVIPALPYFLSFAAGAMLYVVVEELIPEMSQGRALQHRHDFLCRGLQRYDDAGCGAGVGFNFERRYENESDNSENLRHGMLHVRGAHQRYDSPHIFSGKGVFLPYEGRNRYPLA